MTNQKQKTISIRVLPAVDEFLTNNFKTASAGLSFCADAFKAISETSGTIDYNKIISDLEIFEQVRLYSQRELKGKFAATEWKYLIDCLNGVIIPPQLRCHQSVLVASVEDSNSFDNLAAKWGVNMKEFVKELEALTGAQVDAVYRNVEIYWERSSEERIELDGWVESVM